MHITGWADVRRTEREGREAALRPAGEQHAVLEGETTAACGADVLLDDPRLPWGAGSGRRCRECVRLVSPR